MHFLQDLNVYTLSDTTQMILAIDYQTRSN